MSGEYLEVNFGVVCNIVGESAEKLWQSSGTSRKCAKTSRAKQRKAKTPLSLS